MVVKCLVLIATQRDKKKNKKGNRVIVEIIDTDIPFSITKNTKLAGFSIDPYISSVRAATKEGLPRYHVYAIRPLGIIDWSVFKEGAIVELSDIDRLEPNI